MRSVLQDGAGGIHKAGFENHFSLTSCSSGADLGGERQQHMLKKLPSKDHCELQEGRVFQ